MGGLIGVALAWAALNAVRAHDILLFGRYSPVYTSELIAVDAFSTSWLLKSNDLRQLPRRRKAALPLASTSVLISTKATPELS